MKQHITRIVAALAGFLALLLVAASIAQASAPYLTCHRARVALAARHLANWGRCHRGSAWDVFINGHTVWIRPQPWNWFHPPVHVRR